MLHRSRAGTISIAFGNVSFFMVEDTQTVRVDVSRKLLEGIRHPPPKNSDEFVDTLWRHHRLFSEIAASKYRTGAYRPEVNVFVVRIDEDDLI